MIQKDLEEARESLGYLTDAMQMLMEVGISGELTLKTSSIWAEDVARTRELIDNQKQFIAELEQKLEESQ